MAGCGLESQKLGKRLDILVLTPIPLQKSIKKSTYPPYSAADVVKNSKNNARDPEGHPKVAKGNPKGTPKTAQGSQEVSRGPPKRLFPSPKLN